MGSIATNDPAVQSVSLCVTRLRLAETAERIDVLFGFEIPGDPRNIVLDGGPVPLRGEGCDAAFAELLWPLVDFSVAGVAKSNDSPNY